MKKLLPLILLVPILLTSCGTQEQSEQTNKNGISQMTIENEKWEKKDLQGDAELDSILSTLNDENEQGEKDIVGWEQKETEEYVVDQSDLLTWDLIWDSTVSNSTLTEDEKTGLLLMREEEKLAHDVYVTLYEKWGVNIFKNISESEKTHTEAVLGLLSKYNIEDPVKSEWVENGVWVFKSKELQDLYNSLVEKGKTSLVDALVVWITVEDLDISDILKIKSETKNEDILWVYENLERWSRNHLRAFYKNIKKEGWEYSAKYIDQEYFDSIIDSEQERGNGNGWNWKGNR